VTLGVGRDSENLAGLFDEQGAVVKWMIESVIREARKAGVKVGLCGDGRRTIIRNLQSFSFAVD
jgi:pyruvate,water dikinase